MTQVIVATHSEMALGIKKTAEFIMGTQPKLAAFPAYTEGYNDFSIQIKSLVEAHSDEPVVVFTDISGGSVNSELMKLLGVCPNMHLISGVNLPMVMQMLLSNSSDIEQTINDTLREGREGIKYLNRELSSQNKDFDDF